MIPIENVDAYREYYGRFGLPTREQIKDYVEDPRHDTRVNLVLEDDVSGLYAGINPEWGTLQIAKETKYGVFYCGMTRNGLEMTRPREVFFPSAAKYPNVREYMETRPSPLRMNQILEGISPDHFRELERVFRDGIDLETVMGQGYKEMLDEAYLRPWLQFSEDVRKVEHINIRSGFGLDSKRLIINRFGAAEYPYDVYRWVPGKERYRNVGFFKSAHDAEEFFRELEAFDFLPKPRVIDPSRVREIGLTSIESNPETMNNKHKAKVLEGFVNQVMPIVEENWKRQQNGDIPLSREEINAVWY